MLLHFSDQNFQAEVLESKDKQVLSSMIFIILDMYKSRTIIEIACFYAYKTYYLART